MLDIRHNIAALQRELSDAARKQVPFATALAIDEATAAVERTTGALLRSRIDRPTPFTLRGLYRKRARKGRLVGEVGFKRAQAQYLATLERGGARTERGQRVPGAARVDRYGNLPRGAVGKLLASPHVFSGRPKGRPGGIWRRLGATPAAKAGKALRLEVAWIDRATWRPALGWEAMARRRAIETLPQAWARSFARAMATAR